VIATRLSQAQLLALEKPGNALPSPISLPKQGLTFIEGQDSTCCANNSHEVQPTRTAGVAMATAIVSVMTGIPARRDAP
jgi:hypothetical protein